MLPERTMVSPRASGTWGGRDEQFLSLSTVFNRIIFFCKEFAGPPALSVLDPVLLVVLPLGLLIKWRSPTRSDSER